MSQPSNGSRSPEENFWAVQQAELTRTVSDLSGIRRDAAIVAPLVIVLLLVTSVLYSYRQSETWVGYLLNFLAFAFALFEMTICLLSFLVAVSVGGLVAQWIEFHLDPDKWADCPSPGTSDAFRKFSWTIRPSAWMAGILALILLTGLMRLGLGAVWKIPGFGWRARDASWARSVLRIMIVACMMLLGTWCGAQGSWPDLSQARNGPGGGEKDAALVVGVESYAAVAGIPGARENAEAWQGYFADTLKLPVDKVVLLRDNEATLEKIRKYAALVSSRVDSTGTLWFVFIGHGAPSRDGKDGILVGWDAQQDPESLYARSIRREELLGLLAQGKQSRTVVLLDACFSGRGSDGTPLIRGLQPLVLAVQPMVTTDSRVILLTAAKADQFAGPLPRATRMRPAFSYLVLGALRGWAADAMGKVTASALIDFTRRALTLEKGRSQTPELFGSGDVVLGQGSEAAPDLAKIDREGKSTEYGFRFMSLPDMPTSEAPAVTPLEVSGFRLTRVDVDSLEQFDIAAKFERSAVSPQAKAVKWRELAKQIPAYAVLASKRAEEWEQFSIQQKAVQEARQQLRAPRDEDWSKLSRLLEYDVVPRTDKLLWAKLFVEKYLKAPGLEPEMTKVLTRYMPTEDLAKAVRFAAVGKTDIQWVDIPGGVFDFRTRSRKMFGDRPVRKMQIAGFQMSKTEVTIGMYRVCVDAGVCSPPSEGGWCTPSISNWGIVGRESHPVACVSWEQAKTFSEWVGGRLPSEAEWEFAARSAGQDWRFPWGNDVVTCDRAVINERLRGCGKDSTWPVCSKPEGNTIQGLCDISGNVAEWVEDSTEVLQRVFRGGSWVWDRNLADNTYGSGAYPERAEPHLGFRPVRPIPQRD